MHLFSFDRARAERSLADPDGALWPVNAYSDADELDGLIQAALDCGVVSRAQRCARLYVYPLSLSEPDPVLVYDPGHGRACLGHALKLREREGESPIEFTLRLLEDIIAEGNALASDRPLDLRRVGPDEPEDMNLRCPDCCSEEAALSDRGQELACGNCGTAFRREQALVTIADAEGYAEQRAACTCSDVRGCPQCFARAAALVGKTVCDDRGRQWEVTDIDEKDGFPTLGGEDRWAYLADVEVIE